MPLWRYAASKSAATRSRWQWTWVGDDSVFKKYGEQLGLVGTWWSGQEHRVLSGIDGAPARRGDRRWQTGRAQSTLPSVGPIPQALGRRAATNCTGCRACWMRRVAALRQRGVHLPPPIVVADSWFSDSKLMRLGRHPPGTFLVEGKGSYAHATRWAAGQGPRLAAGARLALAESARSLGCLSRLRAPVRRMAP